jgi:predicted protein tyrosine phosphatase
MILFVCSQGRIRSRTAELLCIHGGIEARSCGTDETAISKIGNELLWPAEIVFCMEQSHVDLVKEFAAAEHKRIESLGLRDVYSPMQRDLIEMLINTMRYRDERVHEAMKVGLAEIDRRGLYRELLNPEPRHYASSMFGGDYGG